MFETIKAVKTELDKAHKDLGEKLQGLTKEGFKELFEARPDIEAVRWRQYTPYFNDGSPCTFSVNDTYVKFKGNTDEEADEEAYDYKDGFLDSWSVREDNSKTAAFEVVDDLFSQFDDDAMMAAFGDHVVVTATRDGFDVEEYHD